MSQHKPERSDAKRNREVVIDAAMEVFSAEPNASMAAVAEHSGLGRTTIYRHFTTREELIKALFERAVVEANAATTQVIEMRLSTRETLLALGPAIIAIPTRFSFLAGARSIGNEVVLESTLDPEQPLRHFVSAAQERNEIDPELPTQLVLSSIDGLATGIANELHSGRLTAERAGEVLGLMLVRLFLTESGAAADQR